MICLTCRTEIIYRDKPALRTAFYEHVTNPNDGHFPVRAPRRDRSVNPYCAECWEGEYHLSHCRYA